MKQHLAHRPPAAFTLVEILVSAIIGLFLAAGVYSILYCSNILSAKTTAIGATSVTIQNALDRIQVYLQQSYSTAYPLNTTGAVMISLTNIPGTTAYPAGMVPVVTGTSATVTGTGVGIKFYRYVGGPYLTQVPTSGLLANATSITIVSSTGAQVCPPNPQPGDILLINTTALLGTGTNYQVWATVAGAGSYTEVSGTRTYTLPLTPPLRPGAPDVTTGTIGIAYMYDNNSNSAITWSTYLLRPTAFIISYRSNSASTELGILEPCVTTAGVVNTTTNYTTLATLCSGTSPLLTSTTATPFAVVSFCGNTFVSVNLQTISDTDTYLSGKQAANGFSTNMSVRSMINLKSKPF